MYDILEIYNLSFAAFRVNKTTRSRRPYGSKYTKGASIFWRILAFLKFFLSGNKGEMCNENLEFDSEKKRSIGEYHKLLAFAFPKIFLMLQRGISLNFFVSPPIVKFFSDRLLNFSKVSGTFYIWTWLPEDKCASLVRVSINVVKICHSIKINFYSRAVLT